ncbi:MAG: cation:proton antiporter [Clostridiales bacterium]|nr:cation:proton antiporter [Clostridiales bacterium]
MLLTSLALIFLVGLSLGTICKAIKLPQIIGMLVTGIVLGPYVLDLFDSSILGISAQLRQMALVIILIKAGLSLNLKDLKKVGRPAILMAFLPAAFEICGCIIFAPLILKVSYIEAAIMGAVLGAVSPAVVVPRMVQLMDEKYGTEKGVPQMILAGASLDDVFVIVLFTAFVGIAQGNGVQVMTFLNIPISIVTGILLGAAVGLLLSIFFEFCHKKNHTVRNSVKVIIILGFAFLLLAVETWLKNYFSVSSLLAIMSMAIVLAMRSAKEVVTRLQDKFGKIWIAAELLLFVLVGAAVDIRYTLKAGGGAVAVIFIGLAFRSVGVWLCMLGTKLNQKERLYSVIAYLPKATVQAAIGAIPLSLGLPCGNIVLSVAVLSIIITAPLGAIGMDLTYKKLLKQELPANEETPAPAESLAVEETPTAKETHALEEAPNAE